VARTGLVRCLERRVVGVYRRPVMSVNCARAAPATRTTNNPLVSGLLVLVIGGGCSTLWLARAGDRARVGAHHRNEGFYA